MLIDAQIRLTRFSFVGAYLRNFSGHFNCCQRYDIHWPFYLSPLPFNIVPSNLCDVLNRKIIDRTVTQMVDSRLKHSWRNPLRVSYLNELQSKSPDAL